MANEANKEVNAALSLEYYSTVTAQVIAGLATNSETIDKDQATLHRFFDGIGKRAERSGDFEALNAISKYLERNEAFAGSVVNALEAGWKAEKIEELLVQRAENFEKMREINAMRYAAQEAQVTAKELYAGDHALAEHAERLGYYAGQRAAHRALRIAEHDPSKDNPFQERVDPSVIGLVQTAIDFVNQSRDGGKSTHVSLFEAYEALVATDEDPDGQIAEIDVVRAIQTIEAGELASIDGNVHELAIRLRLALDAGVEPDMHISEALLLPEAAFASPLKQEQVQSIKAQLDEIKPDRSSEHNSAAYGLPSP